MLYTQSGSSSPAPKIVQEIVLDESEVSELIEESEERVVAKALHLVSSGIVHLGADGYVRWGTED